MADKIVIDAGHDGITNPGAVYNGRRESDDVLRLALMVGEILAQNGYDIDYTRTGDTSQSPTQKAQLANEAGADLFISLHRNQASYPGQYNGVQTLIYDNAGFKREMAENIDQNLEGVGFNNIGVDIRTDLGVLRQTDMPALLIEVGFIDSEIDNEIFDSRLNEIAEAIADGIMDTLSTQTADTDIDDDMEQPIRYAYQDSTQMEPAPGRNWETFQTGPGPVMPPMNPTSSEHQTESIMFPEDIPMNNSRPLYRVQVGAFYNLRNAIELEQELKRLGYNTWIVTV